jgi:hypothetical protein
MIKRDYYKELVVLVADLDAENAIRGVLERWQSLGIRQLHPGDYDILKYSGHDSGCRGEAAQFLEGFVRSHAHALVVFDRHGCGWDHLSREEIEQRVEDDLERAGWNDRCAVITLDPELEIWVWSDSPHVEEELGWKNRCPSLREWLVSENHMPPDGVKPIDPKEAMLRALRHVRKPFSARIFSRLSKKVGLNRCRDGAFLKLKWVLQKWFPMPSIKAGE